MALSGENFTNEDLETLLADPEERVQRIRQYAENPDFLKFMLSHVAHNKKLFCKFYYQFEEVETANLDEF